MVLPCHSLSMPGNSVGMPTQGRIPSGLGCSVVSLGEQRKVMNGSGGKAVVPFLLVWSVSNILIYAAFIPFKYKSISCCISHGERAQGSQCALGMSSSPGVPLAGLEGCGSQAPRDSRRAQAFPELCQEPREAVAAFSPRPEAAGVCWEQQQHGANARPALQGGTCTLGSQTGPDTGADSSSQALLGSLGCWQQLRPSQQCLLRAQKANGVLG